MNDDSAEWMAQLKASGQLRPEPAEGIGGDEDARRRVGMAGRAVTDDGQQVLGTCSPGRWVSIKAAIHEFLNLPLREVTEEEQQSIDEQSRIRTEWVRNHRVEE